MNQRQAEHRPRNQGAALTFRRLPAWEIALIAALSLAVLFLSVLSVLSGSTRGSRPDVALKMRPGDTLAAGRLATLFSGQPGKNPERHAVERLAQRSIERDLTAERSMRALGEIADKAGNEEVALARMLLADRLNKRDLAVQIYLLNHFLEQGDIDNLFIHVETAVSISRDANGFLFPVLATALGDDRFITPITDLLAREPWWGPSLVSSIAETAPSIRNASAVFTNLAERGHAPRTDLVEKLLARARSEGDAASAEALESLIASE